MFAPNERIAPFPNFPQPMFERPTPSCKHTHKSTNFLEALPVDARQSRKKDRIHAKASPNIRCPKTRRSSTGCANLKKHKVAYGRKSRTSTPLLSEFRPDTPPVFPRSSSEIRSVRKAYRLSGSRDFPTADTLNLFIREPVPSAGKRTSRAVLLYPITPRTRSSKADKAAFAPSPIATMICL